MRKQHPFYVQFFYRVEANNSNFKSSKLVVNSRFIFTKTL